MRILMLCKQDIDDLDITSGVGEVTTSLIATMGRYYELTLADVRIKSLKHKFYWRLYEWCHRKDLAPRFRYRYLYWAYVERSKIAHKVTKQFVNSVDLVFQVFWRYAPFIGRPLKPYVVYTDTTGRLFFRASEPDCDLSKMIAMQKKWDKESEVYRLAAKIFTYNDRVRRSVIEEYNADPEKVIEVGVGVGLDPMPLNQIKCYNGKRIIFIGRDGAFEMKGVPTLLQAFSRVREVHEDAELVLVGISKDRGIEQPGVSVMGRISDRQKVAYLLEEASLLVLPSRQDESPGVIREAMVKKLPCVASRIGGIPEMVVDGETGRLIPPQDPVYLARVLTELLQDEDQLRRMGEEGYKRALELFTWEAVVAKIREHLQEVVLL